jgi:hypothetical protein
MSSNLSFSGIKLSWARSNAESNYLSNFGDALSPIVTSAAFNLPVIHSDFDDLEAAFVAVGSIGHEIRKSSAVYWGTGIPENLINGECLHGYEYLALRGPISKSRVSNLSNFACPYGDAGILLPRLLPAIFGGISQAKSKDILFIPHISDCDINTVYVGDNIFLNSIISLGADVMTTWAYPNFDSIADKIFSIKSSKIVVSKSFHGHILGVLFGAKTYLLQFSDVKDFEIEYVDLVNDQTVDWRWRDFYLGQRCNRIPVLNVNPFISLDSLDGLCSALISTDFEYPEFDQNQLMDIFYKKYKDIYELDHLFDSSLINYRYLNRITF